MENVVYLLGAGFSAPLGLPVMSNFLVRSKDMYFENLGRYSHFKDVFEAIREISISKNYYDTDLFNIEEILSILHMSEQLEGRALGAAFLKYIVDVINHYTPSNSFTAHESMDYWYYNIFGGNHTWNLFGLFIGAILSLRFEAKELQQEGLLIPHYYAEKFDNSTQYSIITLNYDTIPETICDFVNQHYEIQVPATFNTDPKFDGFKEKIRQGKATSLSKLHGSVSNGIIVPPTWNKSVNTDIQGAWKLAHQLLVEANHLRIIGYSLPIADSYVKYLLKSAVIHADHLKSIDVICLDQDGSVQERFKDFVNFKYFSFISADVVDYLEAHNQKYHWDKLKIELGGIALNMLESAHNNFFGRYS